jgi:AraC-like DNA-binding protein
MRWMEDTCGLSATVHPPFSETASLLLLTVLSYVDAMEHQQRLISALHPALARALQFLEAHFTESFTLQHLAEQAYVSTSHLRALFRQHLNCSPSSYQLQLRMRLAEKLLQDPYLTVSEVAQRCGYTDSNYFVRLFRQQHQLPPGHWRVLLQEIN